MHRKTIGTEIVSNYMYVSCFTEYKCVSGSNQQGRREEHFENHGRIRKKKGE